MKLSDVSLPLNSLPIAKGDPVVYQSGWSGVPTLDTVPALEVRALHGLVWVWIRPKRGRYSWTETQTGVAGAFSGLGDPEGAWNKLTARDGDDARYRVKVEVKKLRREIQAAKRAVQS